MNWRGDLRRTFLIGLAVLAPIGVTAFVLVWLFRTFDGILGRPTESLLGFRIPGIGLVLLVLSVLAIGWLARWTVGRQAIQLWNHLLARFPLTRAVYNVASQIAQALLGDKRQVFQRVVLIEFPHPGSFALAWVTAEDAGPLAKAVGEPASCVFMATTPNPATGFFLVVPKRLIRPTKVTMEESVKLVISAGAVVPGGVSKEKGGGLDLESLVSKSRD